MNVDSRRTPVRLTIEGLDPQADCISRDTRDLLLQAFEDVEIKLQMAELALDRGWIRGQYEWALAHPDQLPTGQRTDDS